jgi:hypothetical protein
VFNDPCPLLHNDVFPFDGSNLTEFAIFTGC